MLIRLDRFLRLVGWYHFALVFVAGLTVLLSGLAAVVERDMKKIIALSTLSQLGVIIGRLGVGAPEFALFHLMTHAIFKALMFMGAGIVIFFRLHWQDLRVVSLRGSGGENSFIATVFFISNFALCGVPFLGGFYSKDKILEFMLGGVGRFIVVLMFILATILTRAYSVRFIFNIGWGTEYRFLRLTRRDEDYLLRNKVIVVLGVGAVAGGALIN